MSQTIQKEARRYRALLHPLLAGSIVLMALGLILSGGFGPLWQGMVTIVTSQSVLVTDYVALAGLGPALFNSGAVALCAILVLRLCGDVFNGFTIVTAGLMAGFALFGKNVANIWPIILGGWLYARAKREPFSKYCNVAMMATALSPLVSFMTLSWERPHPGLGLLTGLVIGFFLPPLAEYTSQFQNGMNLYNAGFACGLLGMMMVPVLKAFGLEPETASIWAKGYNLPVGIAMAVICTGLIAAGLVMGGRAAWEGYLRLLGTTGRSPSDFVRTFGGAPVLLNMGVNGLAATGYILLIGGDLNGATLGGIITIMGFSAYGKHLRNILPVMGGVLLGSVLNHVPLTAPGLQLAGLFGTALAPFSGVFGIPAGVVVGFVHSSVVLHAGLPLEGMNLYNNGFSTGLITVVMYPILQSLVSHRKLWVRNLDYYSRFEADSRISESELAGEDAAGDEDKT